MSSDTVVPSKASVKSSDEYSLNRQPWEFTFLSASHFLFVYFFFKHVDEMKWVIFTLIKNLFCHRQKKFPLTSFIGSDFSCDYWTPPPTFRKRNAQASKGGNTWHRTTSYRDQKRFLSILISRISLKRWAVNRKNVSNISYSHSYSSIQSFMGEYFATCASE